MKKFDKEFEISKYVNWTNVLSRIKRDEQQWIYTLLLIYGAILWFQTNKTRCHSVENFDFSLALILLVNCLISIIWSFQSLNLRAQYYGALIEVVKIQHKFRDLKRKKGKIWFEYNFSEWRKSVTKPNESKLIEFLLLCGLILTSAVLSFFEQTTNWDWRGYWIYIFFYMCLILFILFCLYPCLDRKKLEKIYNDGNLPLKKKSNYYSKSIILLIRDNFKYKFGKMKRRLTFAEY